MPNETADLKSASSKLYGALKDQKPPAQIGKPIFEKCIDQAKSIGARDLSQIFGFKEMGDNSPYMRCLNFGSRKSTGMLPKQTRLMLFGLKLAISDCEIQAQFKFKTPFPTPQQMMDTPSYKEVLEPMLKAFNITDFSTWIPTIQARFFFEEFEIPLVVGDLFDQLPMESATVNVPGVLGRLMGRLEGDTATFAVQSNTQANYTVTAKNNVVHTKITEDLNMDSAPAIIEKLRREVVAGVARAEERSYLDGDVSVAHMDSDVTAATDFRKAYNGLRKRALDNSAAGVIYDHGGDTPSKELFRQLLKKAKRFATEKGDLQWIIGPSIGTDLVTGAIPELFTAFAFGGPASNVTGQLPPVFGIKAVESEYIREDLAATGVHTGTGAFTWMALVKKSRFQRHLRAPVRVWAAPSLPSSDEMLMSAKKRHSFGGVPQTADETSLAIAIHISTDG